MLWHALWNQRNGNRKILISAMACILILLSVGCSNRASQKTDIAGIQTDDKALPFDEKDFLDTQAIAEILSDISSEAVSENTLGSPDTVRRMIARLDERGYVAADIKNQVDMAGAERVLTFCKAVTEKEVDHMTMIVFEGTGFHLYDLKTGDDYVKVNREYYQYDLNGQLQKKNESGYLTDFWQYTEEGYLFFGGSYDSEEDLVLTLSDTAEYIALRILPLDEICRELNRKYILPVGYGRNNIFLTDWDEEEFGCLDFYDIFDRIYPILNGQIHPYTASGGAEMETVYEIPETIFENVVTAHFMIDRETLRSKVEYLPEKEAYEYRPRGFQESEYPDIPFPEVVDYTENADGTITLIVNAVYGKESTARFFTHTTVIRPGDEGGYEYVSNKIISPREEDVFWWHSDRLTGEKEQADSNAEGNGTDTVLCVLPQAETCLLSEAEREETEDTALTAANRAKEVYRDIELTDDLFYGSTIKEFTSKQCREVVSLLGDAGYVSVTDDTNMENYEKVEDFYNAYSEKRNAAVTLYNVERDGLIGANTFIYRDGRLQTYYVEIAWQEGGVPVIKNTSVSNIAEMKLTEKGYLIYAYENVIPHASLRQYWRVKPLSEKCRELTKKYIYGLSYVNYNALVINWDDSNVEDILMPCMFEDIYRIAAGESIKPQNGKIPAETYEKVMTTYFPVSVEQLRKLCGYDEKSDSYAYDMIFQRQYPPFGEVVDYAENADGTITLIVDAVWADYNSDLAFTNRIVVQPFADGTFRYLSNSIKEKELPVPKVTE